MRMKLHQLAESGAADGEVPVWDATLGRWVPSSTASAGGLIDANGDLIVGLSDDTPAILPVGTDGDVLTADSSETLGMKWATPDPGGGAGDLWDLAVDLPLTSLTNWTAGAGAWTAETDRIRQATVSTPLKRLHYSPAPPLPLDHLVAQLEVRVNTAGDTTASSAGITFGTGASADTAGAFVAFRTNGSVAQVGAIMSGTDGSTSVAKALAAPIVNNTWMTLRVVVTSYSYAVWVNGTFFSTFSQAASVKEWGRLALYSVNTDASFKNLKIWTPVLPA